jgi:GNAT superfamily N-acetyltransferase
MDWSLYNPATDMEQDEDIGYGDEDDWYDDDPEPSQGYSGDPYEEYLRLLQNGGVPSNKALSQAVSGMLEDDEIAGVSAEAALLWTSALQEALAGTGVTLRLDQLENDGRELRLSWSLTDDDGHEIGTMNRWATEYEVHHDYFTLEPEYQGKGIAQRLNTAAEDLYRANGIQYITLDANIDVGGYAWAKQGYTLDVDKGGRDAMKDVLRRLAMEITMSSKVFDLVEAFSTHMVYHGDYPANLVYFIEELRSLGVEVDFSDGDEFDYEWRAQVLLQAYLDHFGERDSEDAIFRLLDLAADAFGNSEIQMWDIASFGQGDPKWERTVEITQWDSTGRTMTRTPKVTWPGKEALLGARWPGRKDL